MGYMRVALCSGEHGDRDWSRAVFKSGRV